MRFKTGLKGFWSILFGVIVIAVLVVGSMYFIDLASGEVSLDSDETTQVEEGNQGGNEGGNDGGNGGGNEGGNDGEAIQIDGNNNYIYRID